MNINKLSIHNIKRIDFNHLILPSSKDDQFIKLFMNHGEITVYNKQDIDITNITFTNKKKKELLKIKDIYSYNFIMLGVMNKKREIILFDIMTEKEYFNDCKRKLFYRIKRFNKISKNFKNLDYIKFIDNNRYTEYRNILSYYINNAKNTDFILYLFDYNFNYIQNNKLSYMLYRNDLN